MATPCSQRDLVVHRTGDSISAYRIVRKPHPDDGATIDSFRSNYELGTRPRGLEVESTLIHMGLSMHLRREMAVAVARRWQRIGRHIAVLRLDPGHGFCWAQTGHPGHITVWGRPVQLLDCVIDILAVGD